MASLKEEDLKDTIADVISIDEFEPKSGTVEEIVVIAFYAIDEEPAKDLDTFLETSYLELLDVEVSPNPNDDGYYLVFIEIKRDENFHNVFTSLVTEVNKLVGKIDWKVSPYLATTVYDYSDDTWKNFVITDKDSYKSKEQFINNTTTEEAFTMESIVSALRDTDITDVLVEDQVLKLVGNNVVVNATIIDFCTEDQLMERYDFSSNPLELFSTKPMAKHFQSIMGNTWSVYPQGTNRVVLSNGDKALYLEID